MATTTTTTTTTTVSINGKTVDAEVFHLDRDEFLRTAYIETPDGEGYGTCYTVAGAGITYYNFADALAAASLQLALDREAVAAVDKAENAYAAALAARLMASVSYDLDNTFLNFCMAADSPATIEQAREAYNNFEMSRVDLDQAEEDVKAAREALAYARKAADQARARIAQAERVLAEVMASED